MQRFIRFSVICAITAAALLSTGCSHITMLRTEELREVSTRVDSLHTELSSMQKELLKEQKSHNELLRLIRADQQVRFAELSHKVSTLEGSITESQQQLSMINAKTQEIKKQWDEKARSDSLAQSLQNAEMNKLFQLAHEDFMARRYDLAASGFRDFKVQHPEAPLAEDATYWIAECYYAQGNDTKAEDAYKDYLKEYPEGKKTCPVLYKLGMIYARQDKTKRSTLVWKKLVEQCPDSEEASAVRNKIQ